MPYAAAQARRVTYVCAPPHARSPVPRPVPPAQSTSGSGTGTGTGTSKEGNNGMQPACDGLSSYCLNLVRAEGWRKINAAITATKKRFRSDEQHAGLGRSAIYVHVKRLRAEAAEEAAADQAAVD